MCKCACVCDGFWVRGGGLSTAAATVLWDGLDYRIARLCMVFLHHLHASLLIIIPLCYWFDDNSQNHTDNKHNLLLPYKQEIRLVRLRLHNPFRRQHQETITRSTHSFCLFGGEDHLFWFAAVPHLHLCSVALGELPVLTIAAVKIASRRRNRKNKRSRKKMV